MEQEKILKEMSLEEKIHLLSGSMTIMGLDGIERFDIKPLRMSDATMGVRVTESKNPDGAVCFPCAAAMAATWNRELIHTLGEAIGEECINEDKDMILGPGLNIKRTPHCGRNFEYFSEDPYLAGELGAEYIKGVQEKGVGTSLKHFAMNNQELNRDYVSVEADERTMREIYLRPFEIAVKKAKPKTVMSAYNKVNSVYASENKYLLNDVLKNEWGFEGAVVSDWCAVHNIGFSVKAGLDVQMPSNPDIEKELKSALDKGIVTENDIDKAAMRVLKLLTESAPEKIKYDRKKQHEIAKKVSEESICLLKNDGILPIKEEKYGKINIVGDYAADPLICGGGSAEVKPDKSVVDSPFESIKAQLKDKSKLCYIENVIGKDAHRNGPIFPARGVITRSIQKDDLTIIFAGTTEYSECEATDRSDIHFDPHTDEMIRVICGCCDNVIVVMQSGDALIPCQWQERAKGIVQMWFAGEAGGAAIADVLFGKVNPSGKLSQTFMLEESDINYPGTMRSISYDEKWRVGYRYYDLHPEKIWFPFGHGLSYTEFLYSDLNVEVGKESVKVSVKVKNIGDTAGKETVQVYVSDKEATVSRPIKELKAFEKTELLPGEEKTLSFELDERAFAFYNVVLKKWYVESGEFEISIGSSSRDIRLQKTVCIEKEDEYTMKNYSFSIMG